MGIKNLFSLFTYFRALSEDEVVVIDEIDTSIHDIYLNKLSVISMNIKKYKKMDLIVIIGKKGGKYKSGIELNIIENEMEKR